MAEQASNRQGGNGKLIAVWAGVGLLLGAGVVTPFALNYRSSMQQAQDAAVAAAALAEKNKQEAVALEKQKGELRENLGQAEKTISTLKGDLSARGEALEAIKQSDAAKSKDIDSLRTDIQKKTAAMTDLDERLKAARAEVETTTKANTDLVAAVNGLRSEVSRMSETVQTQVVEIARLVEVAKKEEQAKQVALKDAAEAHQIAQTNAARADATHAELMTLAPVRIEERNATKTGRKIAEKSGVPFGALFDGIGDVFQGVGEVTLGKNGPVILVAVYKDGHEETLTNTDAGKWTGRGIPMVKLGSKKA
jgi:chromosome segregation ATPase